MFDRPDVPSAHEPTEYERDEQDALGHRPRTNMIVVFGRIDATNVKRNQTGMRVPRSMRDTCAHNHEPQLESAAAFH